jgi:hypothetical protein
MATAMIAQLKALWTSGKLMIGLGVLLALAASHLYVYRAGGEEARVECAQAEASRVQGTLDALVEAGKEAQARDKELRKKLDNLPSSYTLETIIRENPSVCIVPGPVDERLRQDIRAVNQARAR